jgi:hypothetical protein
VLLASVQPVAVPVGALRVSHGPEWGLSSMPSVRDRRRPSHRLTFLWGTYAIDPATRLVQVINAKGQTFVSKIGPQGDLVEACVQHRELPGSVKVGDHLTLDLLDMHARNVRDEHIGLIAFSEHQQKS